ncbi:MAG: hypothetical protein IPH07_29860 [Deltaproteobacteria bacterium]|nr:hypothetical protein [Deltaproteobacteria bacterium]MBK8234391.1 hypothetical protein [Deltaproteobacteria bacterium]MBK8715118.1 hypothetical protein [Deltaproteobacteria bacterium]MBP7287136.1 hypothetical protein [Nannocystaceae bacterium]
MEGLDEWFRLRYELRLHGLRQRLLAGTDPLIIRCGDDLVFLHDRQRRRVPVVTRRYHACKALAHLPVATYVWLAELTGTALTPDDHRALERMHRDTTAALGRAAVPAEREVLAAVANALRSTLARGGVDLEALTTMATAVDPPTRALIDEATRLELVGLDAAVRRHTASLTIAQWQRLHVVVCANHQARYKESTKQYFQRLLGESEGPGAQREHRVLYAESGESIDDAVTLLATHLLDRELAGFFLDSPMALQRNVLGDAASRVLDELFAERIG